MTSRPLDGLETRAGLGDLLDHAGRAWAGEVCLIESDRERETERLTYAEVRRRALALAGGLEAAGFAPGERAAVLASNQSKWHVSAFAVFLRGGVLVPLDFLATPAEQLALLEHARPAVLFVEAHLWRALAATDGFQSQSRRRVLVLGAPPGEELPAAPAVTVSRWEDCRDERFDAPPRRRRPDDLASIVYSSGTGGRPKGCQLTHGNYLAQLGSLVELHPLAPGHRYLSILPTNHAIDFMVGFIGPYACGAAVVHLRTLRPEWVRDALRRYRVTHVSLVPAHLAGLEGVVRRRIEDLPAARRALFRGLEALTVLLSRGRPRPRIARRLLRPVHRGLGGRLEAVFVGGAPCDPSTLRFFHRLGIPVANGYGLTEACTAVTLDRLDPPRPETVGRPLPGVELRIVEPDRDGVGEVAVRGATVMRGYLDEPALTAEALVDGWLMTGDLGRLDDGHLELRGRRKNMIVTAGGKNVYPEDVEIALEGIGTIEHCVFAAHFLWPSRGADERLVLVARPAEDGDEDILLAALTETNRRLPPHQRLAGVLPWTTAFPRTASMKLRRAALAEEIRRRRPDPAAVVGLDRPAHRAPTTDC